MISLMPSQISDFKSRVLVVILLESAAASMPLSLGDGTPGGVGSSDGVADRRLNIDWTAGTPLTTAYDVCEVMRDGLVCWSNGLLADAESAVDGRWWLNAGAACILFGVTEPASLLTSSFLSSIISSRIRPNTRRTMFPTTISLGWASISRCPTSCMRRMRSSASLHFRLDTTRRKSFAVATAHGLEFLICLCLSSLRVNQHIFTTRLRLVRETNEIRSSMHDSTGWFSLSLRYARNVDRVGV